MRQVWQELMRLDEQELNNKYKVGILYCKKGQTSEEDMYNNETGSEAFEAFLQAIGTKVTMKGFTKYRAQLDNKTDTTGSHSIHTEHQGTEIMFHISTYLPHTPSNSQQVGSTLCVSWGSRRMFYICVCVLHICPPPPSLSLSFSLSLLPISLPLSPSLSLSLTLSSYVSDT